MTQEEIISKTIVFVKRTLKGAEGGHDWFHIHRVLVNSRKIAATEKVNDLVVALGALLHDIADAKFHDGDETKGPKIATDFLTALGVDQALIEQVVYIIENISFKNSLEKGIDKVQPLELQVVQDADRLDAIGAIGIARAFNYGGFKNRELYNPEIKPNLHMSKEEYKKSASPTINHFYEKLLLLKKKFNTESGKRLAEERHRFMLEFLEQFYQEWGAFP
ncbi:HD domain-containing protein [Aggregatimonas sangjinii]|uniref:HD domain-containing protein n=1 Tax=Aggregatimonas sangjinii TaxID=2583587 RepID=A0A5B7SSP9_9FLAO|nr:HD domain-containing protein [Aggregatimonas sangjinii]QCX01557.1 HD domain-containing protein [Aggregatimonas sangjinii]